MGVLKPKRGSVWFVALDPARGSEVKKLRPAVVVSNDISNKYLDRVQVVPLTSNVLKVYPSECLVTIKKQPAKAMTDQIRTVSIERLGKCIGNLSENEMQLLENVLRLQLGL